MPEASRDEIGRHAAADQVRPVRAAKIVEPEAEAELAGSHRETASDGVRVARLREIERAGRGGEHQRLIRQPDQRQVDSRAIRHASGEAQILVVLGA